MKHPNNPGAQIPNKSIKEPPVTGAKTRVNDPTAEETPKKEKEKINKLK